MAFKKPTVLTGLILSSALLFAGCGREDEVTEPVGENAGSEAEGPADANPTGGVENTGGETFGFTEFSLNVDYPDQDDALDVSYEEDRDRVEAEYEDKQAGTNLSGNDAMDQIEEAFGNLDLNPDMPDEEVITSVVEAFEVQDGFSEIEVEVTYADGTDKEYRMSGQQ